MICERWAPCCGHVPAPAPGGAGALRRRGAPRGCLRRDLSERHLECQRGAHFDPDHRRDGCPDHRAVGDAGSFQRSRRRLPGDRGPGHRRARPAGQAAPRADDPLRGRAEDPHRGPVPSGQPARHDRRLRGNPEGPRPVAGRRLAGEALRRPAGLAGGRLLRPEGKAAIRGLALGAGRRDREDHLRPRVHPRPPGPELRSRGDRRRRRGPGGSLARPAFARRGRRHPPHDPLADPAPRPLGAHGAVERRPGVHAPCWLRCRRSCARRSSSRTSRDSPS